MCVGLSFIQTLITLMTRLPFPCQTLPLLPLNIEKRATAAACMMKSNKRGIHKNGNNVLWWETTWSTRSQYHATHTHTHAHTNTYMRTHTHIHTRTHHFHPTMTYSVAYRNAIHNTNRNTTTSSLHYTQRTQHTPHHVMLGVLSTLYKIFFKIHLEITLSYSFQIKFYVSNCKHTFVPFLLLLFFSLSLPISPHFPFSFLFSFLHSGWKVYIYFTKWTYLRRTVLFI